MKAKRLVSAILATAMTFSCAVSASAYNYGECVYKVGDQVYGCNTYTIGDATQDGKINISDIIAVAAHVKGKKFLTDDIALAAADTNGDGSINITDVIRIAAFVKGKTR